MEGSVQLWKTVSSNLIYNLFLAHVCMDKMANDPTCGLFCIFDGHGGRQVSDHCAERVPMEFRKELLKKPQDLNKAILDVYDRVRKQYKNQLCLDR
jgi:serine/threonine protein phosphatase PrpC